MAEDTKQDSLEEERQETSLALFREPENLEEAQAMMADIVQLRAELRAEAERDGDVCFWCCGCGDDREYALPLAHAKLVSLFPATKLEEE